MSQTPTINKQHIYLRRFTVGLKIIFLYFCYFTALYKHLWIHMYRNIVANMLHLYNSSVTSKLQGNWSRGIRSVSVNLARSCCVLVCWVRKRRVFYQTSTSVQLNSPIPAPASTDIDVTVGRLQRGEADGRAARREARAVGGNVNSLSLIHI